jgi:uncharacterized protein YecE (DUF72 family)
MEMSRSIDRKILIGCQSWGYDDWITPAGGPYVFYPPGTKKSQMLAFYSRVFNTVEIDATVYGIPQSTTLEKWYAETPNGFIFSLKTPREITHEGMLSAETIPVMREFVERVADLREKLGVVLIQLPPHFDASRDNAQKFRRFLDALPPGFKYSIEFRHPDWFVDWTYDEIKENNAALALVDGPWVPRQAVFDAARKLDSRFAFIRLMNARDLEKFDRIARHRDDELLTWKGAIHNLTATEIHIYIDNYFEGFAPGTAERLQRVLGLRVTRAEDFQQQPSLF